MSRAPVVLLHGILDTPDAWARIAPLLREQRWEVATVPADAVGDDPSPMAQAARVLATLPAGGAHLVGHSRGGTAASWLAVDHPERVLSLALIASPPHASEVFRAAFRKRLARADDADRAALDYLATIPEDDFPQHALRRYARPALVVEYEDDPLYSPTQTLFWRMFLPYAAMERVPGGHRAFAESDEAAAWLAARLAAHLEAADA